MSEKVPAKFRVSRLISGENELGLRAAILFWARISSLSCPSPFKRLSAEASYGVLGQRQLFQIHVFLEHGAEESDDVSVVHAERLEICEAAEGRRLEQSHLGEDGASTGDYASGR